MKNKKRIITNLLLIIFYSNLAYADSKSEITNNYNAWQESPRTDGYGLLPKPQDLTQSQTQKIHTQGKNLCETGCTTKFGTQLGIADNTVAYSNCQSKCIRPEYSFMNLTSNQITLHQSDPNDKNLHYVGLIYQCVEYSRRWWMINKGITYGSIDSAYEVMYLETVKNIYTGELTPLARSINGTAKRPPTRGDLIVYYPDRSNPRWKHGHIAVVVATDLKAGTVSIAEENYSNSVWQKPKSYSRKIQLFKIADRYTVLDVNTKTHVNNNGGRIAAWIYPEPQKVH